MNSFALFMADFLVRHPRCLTGLRNRDMVTMWHECAVIPDPDHGGPALHNTGRVESRVLDTSDVGSISDMIFHQKSVK